MSENRYVLLDRDGVINHDSDHFIKSPEQWRRRFASRPSCGASPMPVKTGKGEKTLFENPNLNIPVFDNLYDAAKYITSRQ